MNKKASVAEKVDGSSKHMLVLVLFLALTRGLLFWLAYGSQTTAYIWKA
jgi:hypothetical protein